MKGPRLSPKEFEARVEWGDANREAAAKGSDGKRWVFNVGLDVSCDEEGSERFDIYLSPEDSARPGFSEFEWVRWEDAE